MTVKDLIEQEIDVDVYDDVCEELGIAFCGDMKLTADGKKKFAEVLTYPVELIKNRHGNIECAVVHIDDEDDDVLEARLRKAKDFFESAAGYCAADDWDKWFVVD